MESVARKKWDRAAGRYDLFCGGAERRWAAWKREFFSPMEGRVLFVAVGTGLDIQFFPPDRDIVAIDVSPNMLAKARPRAAAYSGRLELKLMDAERLDFEDASFDQIFTSCTFCSVPDPVRGLRELRRVLRPSGRLSMFEHTQSRWFPFNLMLHVMTLFTRRVGPEMNRDTLGNVEQAGFRIRRVRNLYLDVLKTIEAAP